MKRSKNRKSQMTDVKRDEARRTEQDEARDAKRDATRDVERDEARDEARDEERDEARDEERDETWHEGQDEASDEEWDDAMYPERDEIRDEERDGARDAERDEERDETRDAKRDGARDAERDADSEEARGYAESIIETLRESLLVLDVDMKVLSANSSFYNTFNVTPTNTIGSLVYELGNQQWDIPGLHILLEDILQKNTEFNDYEVVHEFESIGRKVMLLNARRIYRDDIGTQTILLAIEDVTVRRQMEEKLLATSVTDDLTGLTNRRGFIAMADKLLKLAKRQGQSLILLYIDMDGLKTINDTFGHGEGDRALVDAANILDKTYRESDIVARIGGDEFVVVQVGTEANSTKAIRSRLGEAVKVHNSESNRKYKISLSAGVVYSAPEAPCSISELLVQGDKAMYEQKRIILTGKTTQDR